MQPYHERRWTAICSRSVMFKLMLFFLITFLVLQIVELFVNVHYSEYVCELEVCGPKIFFRSKRSGGPHTPLVISAY